MSDDMFIFGPQRPIYNYIALDQRHRLARRGRDEENPAGQASVGKRMPEPEHPIGPWEREIPDLGGTQCAMGSCPRCGRTLILATRSRLSPTEGDFSMLCRPDCDGVWPRVTPLGLP